MFQAANDGLDDCLDTSYPDLQDKVPTADTLLILSYCYHSYCQELLQ